MKNVKSWKTFNENVFDDIPTDEYDANSFSDADRQQLIQNIEDARNTNEIEEYDEEVEFFAEELSQLINSALEIYLSYEDKNKLYNLFKQGHNIQAVTYNNNIFNYPDADFDDDEQEIENHKNREYLAGFDKTDWKLFHKVDNYDEVELIYTIHHNNF